MLQKRDAGRRCRRIRWSMCGAWSMPYTPPARVAAYTSTVHVKSLVAAGVDSVEHGYGLDENDLATLVARGGVWTPEPRPVRSRCSRSSDFPQRPPSPRPAPAARRYLGLAGLTEGRPADLVTYHDDPRDDPRLLARPVAVLANGSRIR